MAFTDMLAGAEVGPGWRDILTELDVELKAIDPNVRYAQAKDKGGALRVYVDTPVRRGMSAAIRRAEERAAQTCTRCGQQADAGRGAPLCGKHFIESIGDASADN